MIEGQCIEFKGIYWQKWIHEVCHVAQPCFNRSPKKTEQTLVTAVNKKDTADSVLCQGDYSKTQNG